MKKDSILAAFFSAIEKDQRLGISHIGLYATLIWLWEKTGLYRTGKRFWKRDYAAFKNCKYGHLPKAFTSAGAVRIHPVSTLLL